MKNTTNSPETSKSQNTFGWIIGMLLFAYFMLSGCSNCDNRKGFEVVNIRKKVEDPILCEYTFSVGIRTLFLTDTCGQFNVGDELKFTKVSENPYLPDTLPALPDALPDSR